ncbi:LacI family DNA-binding transcriptional regulator [Actinopolymorpha sp. B17G11]|uniref:LacI family DNA-binding transcriptional regulator n=1 Tax=Actinopolymorpha sp. B17G11 TaxID=3160861 RepID=UPI0032E40DAC
MVTMYDVAKRAELSVGTVSRYVNDSGYVGAASREKIRRAIAELGFVPSTAARSLTTKMSGLIGFVASDLTNPFTAELAQGLQERASHQGYCVVTSSTDGDEQRTLEALTVLESHQVDGLVVTPPETPAINDHLVTAARKGTPIVLIGMELDPPVADRVTTDTYQGARLAVEHLLELGHRRIAYVGARSQAKGRRRAYADTLRAAGISGDKDLIAVRALNRQGGVSAGSTLLDLSDPPTAVFAANDSVALGVVQAAYRRKLRVPDDVSVVGFDDTDLAEHAIPPLTTVAQPKLQMGHEAISLLFHRIKGTGPDRIVERRLTCELVVRDSTAPAAASRRRRAQRSRRFQRS